MDLSRFSSTDVLNNYKHLFYGCAGGFFGTVLSYPIDTVKTRVQFSIPLKQSLTMRNYYGGVGWQFLLVPIEKGIVFWVSEKFKSFGLQPIVCGGIAGLASTFVVTPMEYLKINIQGATKCDTKINFKQLNIREMYKGFILTNMREIPGYAVYIATYDYLTKYNQEKSLFKSFLFGGITGFAAWLVIYPADLIKTKIQDKNNTKSAMEIVKIVYNSSNEKKLFNFYKGLSWALIRAMPLHAGVFLGVEYTKYLVEK